MEKITYTPGRLARKLGLSKGKLMKHLHETGLIEECFASKTGRWQIPYDVAVKISSVETLALSTTPVTRSRRKADADAGEIQSRNGTLYQTPPIGRGVGGQRPLPPLSQGQPNYAQIGKTLRAAGITIYDVIKYVEQQMEVTHEKSLPYNSTKRDENQTSEPATNGSTGPDISNSSEK